MLNFPPISSTSSSSSRWENLAIFIFTTGHAANFLLTATTTATCESETLKKASNVFIMLPKAKPISQALENRNCCTRRSCNMACHQILLLFKWRDRDEDSGGGVAGGGQLLLPQFFGAHAKSTTLFRRIVANMQRMPCPYKARPRPAEPLCI